jgi:PAS domain S-box-containing protein
MLNTKFTQLLISKNPESDSGELTAQLLDAAENSVGFTIVGCAVMAELGHFVITQAFPSDLQSSVIPKGVIPSANVGDIFNLSNNEFFRTSGLRSFYGTLISVPGSPAGVIFFADADHRSLSEKDELVLHLLAEKLSVQFEAMRTDNKYKPLLESSRDALYRLDENGYIELANAAVKKMIGYEPSELSGKPFAEIISPNDRNKHAEVFSNFRYNISRSEEYVCEIITKQNGIRAVVIQEKAEYNAAGDFIGTVGTLTPIEDHESVEKQLDLEQEHLQTLFEYSIKIRDAATFSEKLNLILEAFTKIGWKSSSLSMYDDDLNITHRASNGHSNDGYTLIESIQPSPEARRQFLAAALTQFKYGDSCCLFDLRHIHEAAKQYVFIEQDRIEKKHFSDRNTDTLEWADYNVFGVPLMETPEKIIGFIELNRPTANMKPNPQSLKPIEIFAALTARHIAEFRLKQELADKNARLSLINSIGKKIASELNFNNLLDTILDQLVPFFNAMTASFMLVDQSKNTVTLVRSYKETYKDLIGLQLKAGEGLVGWCVRNGISEIVADVRKDDRVRADGVDDKIGPTMCIVIKSTEGRIIGAIEIFRGKDEPPFKKNDLEFMSPILPFISTAIQNAKLYEKESELTRHLKETTRVKNEFLSNISHELKTPLSSIVAYTEIAMRDFNDISERHRMSLSRIKESSDYLLELINDLLDLSRLEAGQFKLALMNSSLDSIIQPCLSRIRNKAAEKKITLDVKINTSIKIIKTDETRLQQVLMNLLSNAVKFTQYGGITFAVEDNDGWIHFRISDTGIGISKENYSLIFDSFVQIDTGTANKRPSGSGLGLTISKQIVELMGGQISVESNLGKGSTFTISLPLAT